MLLNVVAFEPVPLSPKGPAWDTLQHWLCLHGLSACLPHSAPLRSGGKEKRGVIDAGTVPGSNLATRVLAAFYFKSLLLTMLDDLSGEYYS